MDRSVPLLLHTALVKSERPSRVARFAFPCALLAKWTEAVLRGVLTPAPGQHQRGGGGRRRLLVDSCGGEEETKVQVPARKGLEACEWTARG